MLIKKLYKMRFNLEERMGFYELIAGYLDSNLSFPDALKRIYNRSKKEKNFKADIYKDILDKIQSGQSISNSIKDWIPDNEFMLLEAGEKSTRITESFKEAIYMAESIGRIKKLIISNMFMPFIMLFILFGLFLGFRLKMAETFINFIPIEKWTDNAQNVYYITDFVYQNWMIIVGVFFALNFLIFSTINTFTGKIRSYLDHIPPYNIYKKFVESSFLITFSSLLKAGFSVMDSLKNMKRNATPYLEYYLVKMIDNMSLGKSDGEAINVGLLNKSLAGYIEDVASMNSFDETVYKIGRRNIDKSVIEVQLLMKTVNTLLTMFILGFTLYMFFAIQELSFSISDSLTQ